MTTLRGANVKQKHNHREAFCLMEYNCNDCGHSETIWNSRDGVTPFSMQCPKCEGNNMLHVNWQHDQYAPDHVPVPGQGIWIDMPESLKRPTARLHILSGAGTVLEAPKDKEEELMELIIEDFEPGMPWLIRW